ncbi:MAG: hypothetical protein CFE44_04185 [Burkholderiales bacterium PBB4]|nr:MAG: hypothetical protein CFE44_04185 [Burkholderiales bacterium PBB4]
MIRHMRASGLSLFVGSIALSLSFTASQAQDISIGKAVFANTCAQCHGLPPILLHGAEIAAGDPGRIDSAISIVRTMSPLRQRITPQDIRDIAAYLERPSSLMPNASQETERLFAWAEWKYQAVLQPRIPTQQVEEYQVRYYAKPRLYLGIARGQLWLLDEKRLDAGVQRLGTTEVFLEMARSEGF